jgi:hypothetical protein
MMFATVDYKADPHLCFAQPVIQPHPRNPATIAKLRKAFESFPFAKICAKARRQPWLT